VFSRSNFFCFSTATHNKKSAVGNQRHRQQQRSQKSNVPGSPTVESFTEPLTAFVLDLFDILADFAAGRSRRVTDLAEMVLLLCYVVFRRGDDVAQDLLASRGFSGRLHQPLSMTSVEARRSKPRLLVDDHWPTQAPDPR